LAIRFKRKPTILTEIFLRWGVPILSGFLLGLLAIAWIDPQTSGGSILILVTFISISVVTSAFGTALRVLFRGYPRPKTKSAPPPVQPAQPLASTLPVISAPAAAPTSATPAVNETSGDAKPGNGA